MFLKRYSVTKNPLSDVPLDADEPYKSWIEKKTINEVSRRIYRSSIVSNFPDKERDVTAFMGRISVENPRGCNINLLWGWRVLRDPDTPTKGVVYRGNTPVQKPRTGKCYCPTDFKHHAWEMHELIGLLNIGILVSRQQSIVCYTHYCSYLLQPSEFLTQNVWAFIISKWTTDGGILNAIKTRLFSSSSKPKSRFGWHFL